MGGAECARDPPTATPPASTTSTSTPTAITDDEHDHDLDPDFDGRPLGLHAGGPFEISSGGVALLDDPTGLLSQHVAPGPLTPAKRFFLVSLMTGGYREVVREQPGVAYLPRYADPP